MQKLVDGILVDLTQEEITSKQAEEKAWLDGKEKREALNRIKELDLELPRYAEDFQKGRGIKKYDAIIAEKEELRLKLK